jgi:hypothetical protein
MRDARRFISILYYVEPGIDWPPHGHERQTTDAVILISGDSTWLGPARDELFIDGVWHAPMIILRYAAGIDHSRRISQSLSTERVRRHAKSNGSPQLMN